MFFWDDLKVVLNSLNIIVRLDIKAVLLGILERENMSGLVNYILLESKYVTLHGKTGKKVMTRARLRWPRRVTHAN